MLKFLFTAVFLFSPFTPLWAASEGNFSRIYELLKTGEGSFYQRHFFVGSGNQKIFYTRYGNERGQNGSLVISPGRTESSLKYLEVADDFIQKGFSPVYVIDHRGQGFSDRSLSDPHKGYISDYAVYERDFLQFLDLVLADQKVDSHKLFLLSHSMGGAIVTEAMMKQSLPFRAAAFISPMYQIANERSESQLLEDTALACYVLFSCNDYVPDGGPFRWENRRFEGNDLTHSRVRFQYRDHLWRTFPRLQLGDSTIRWVRESVQADIRIRDISRLSRLRIPFLIFQGTEDTVVDSRGAVEVCKRMKAPCQRLIVKGARHEILMEKDALRSAALKRLFRFFKDKSP